MAVLYQSQNNGRCRFQGLVFYICKPVTEKILEVLGLSAKTSLTIIPCDKGELISGNESPVFASHYYYTDAANGLRDSRRHK